MKMIKVLLTWFLFINAIAALAQTTHVQRTTSADTIPIHKSDTLQEVVVKAEKIKYDAEGYRLNVATIPQLQTMDLAEMMSYLPGMEVADNQMSVYGNGVAEVYINNKKVRLSGEQLQQYLRAIDGKNVRSIQVVTSSGAEMSAQSGGMAVLKILTKRPEDGGMANVNMSNDFSKVQNALSPKFVIEQRRGPWSFYTQGLVDISHSKTHNTRETLFQQSQMRLINKGEDTFNHKVYFFLFGGSYDFSPNDYLSVDAQLSHQRGDSETRDEVRRTVPAISDEHYADNMIIDTRNDHQSFAVTYFHKWDSGQLSTSVNGSWSQNDDHRYQEREGNPQLWNSNNVASAHYQVLTGELDITQRLSDKWGTMKTGGSYATWNNRINSDFSLTENGQLSPYGNYMDRYRYREQTAAAYASWDWQRGAFSSSLGLRYEHKVIDPHSEYTPEQSYKSIYNELFPTLRLNYVINAKKGHSLRLSANRKYNVPQMMQMNPYVRWEGEYAYSMGNPYLVPAMGNRFSAILTMWNRFSLTANYINEDNFEVIYEKEADRDIYFSTTRNGANRRGWELMFSGMQPIGKRGVLNVNASKQLRTITYQGEKTRVNGWRANASFSYRLPLDLNLSLSANYSSPMKRLNRTEMERYGGSIGLSRSFLDNRLNIQANYRYSPNTTYTVQPEGVSSSSKTNVSAHRFSVSARYMLRWGNKRAKINKANHGNSETLRM